MNVEELMLGDWVYGYDGEWKPVCVKQIMGFHPSIVAVHTYGYQPDQIKPIPITPEILEANGWVHYHPYNKKAEYWQLRGWVDVNIKVNRGHFFFSIYGKPFKETFFRPHFTAHLRYVHELQHALRLCGLDKEIVL